MSLITKILERTKKYETTLDNVQFALHYLQRYGYLVENFEDLTIGDIIKAVKLFQSFFGGLKVDGEIGPKTVSAMRMPRCGCPDILPMTDGEVEEARWRKTNLKYYIAGWVGDGISKSEQRDILKTAWKDWTDVARLHIQEVNSSRGADIIIDVGSGSRYNFDGAGGTLAWAYLPNGSDRQLLMRFDLGETWVLSRNQRGVLLRNVACHEFGHLLGLRHSNKQGALMAPYYNPSVVKPVWNDDVTRIQGLYGKAEPQPEPEPEPEPPTPDPEPTPPTPNGETVIVIKGQDIHIESNKHHIYPRN